MSLGQLRFTAAEVAVLADLGNHHVPWWAAVWLERAPSEREGSGIKSPGTAAIHLREATRGLIARGLVELGDDHTVSRINTAVRELVDDLCEPCWRVDLVLTDPDAKSRLLTLLGRTSHDQFLSIALTPHGIVEIDFWPHEVLTTLVERFVALPVPETDRQQSRPTSRPPTSRKAVGQAGEGEDPMLVGMRAFPHASGRTIRFAGRSNQDTKVLRWLQENGGLLEIDVEDNSVWTVDRSWREVASMVADAANRYCTQSGT